MRELSIEIKRYLRVRQELGFQKLGDLVEMKMLQQELPNNLTVSQRIVIENIAYGFIMNPIRQYLNPTNPQPK